MNGDEVDFCHGHAVIDDIPRELRLRLAFPHLGEYLVGIGVGPQFEVVVQRHHAVVGVDGIHVVQVVDAGHLLLDGGGHRLLHGKGVGAGVGGVHLDGRRDDVGELGDGKPRHGHQSQDNHEDRDHHGHNGAIDEEF